MSRDNNNNYSRARPDMGGGGGLRGDPAVPLPLPAPSPPLFPSVVQGGSAPTGGVALRGGGLPGSSTNLLNFLQPSFLANLPAQLPPSPPPPRPPLPPSSPPAAAPPPPPSTPLVPLVSKPLGVPPESLLPLKDCPNPHFCVGGMNHTYFLPPGTGRDLPTREQVEWFTLR